MEDNHQLKLDLEELRHLQSIAQRRRIINLLNILSKKPHLVSDILNSEKKSPPASQSSQSKVSNSSAVSKVAATKEVATSVTSTKQLENQQRRHREVTSTSAWRPREEKNTDEHRIPNTERFSVSMKIPNYVREYEGCISNGKQLKKVTVSLAGKIANKLQRFNSSNLFFYDLEGAGSKVQIVAEASNSELAESEFYKLHSGVMPDDLVGVIGFPGKTNRGDLSIFARSFVPLSKRKQT